MDVRAAGRSQDNGTLLATAPREHIWGHAGNGGRGVNRLPRITERGDARGIVTNEVLSVDHQLAFDVQHQALRVHTDSGEADSVGLCGVG
jgi:hypothetical protein